MASARRWFSSPPGDLGRFHAEGEVAGHHGRRAYHSDREAEPFADLVDTACNPSVNGWGTATGKPSPPRGWRRLSAVRRGRVEGRSRPNPPVPPDPGRPVAGMTATGQVVMLKVGGGRTTGRSGEPRPPEPETKLSARPSSFPARKTHPPGKTGTRGSGEADPCGMRFQVGILPEPFAPSEDRGVRVKASTASASGQPVGAEALPSFHGVHLPFRQRPRQDRRLPGVLGAVPGGRRPLVGFSIKSWFPLQEFSASAAWQDSRVLTPGMVDPEAFLDQERLLREGEVMGNDILKRPVLQGRALAGRHAGSRAAHPARHGPGRRATLPWDELESVRLNPGNPWFVKYVDFVKALVRRSAGRYPVSHGALIGPSDILALLRGHTRSVLDLLEYPTRRDGCSGGAATCSVRSPRRHGNASPCFTAAITTPSTSSGRRGRSSACKKDPQARSLPAVRGVSSRWISRSPGTSPTPSSTCIPTRCSSTTCSWRLRIRCFQVNYEAGSGGPPVAGMIPVFRKIQAAGRPLLGARVLHAGRAASPCGFARPARAVPVPHGQVAPRSGGVAAGAGDVARRPAEDAGQDAAATSEAPTARSSVTSFRDGS